MACGAVAHSTCASGSVAIARRGIGTDGTQGRAPRAARSLSTWTPPASNQMACGPLRQTAKRSTTLAAHGPRTGSAETTRAAVAQAPPRWIATQQHGRRTGRAGMQRASAGRAGDGAFRHAALAWQRLAGGFAVQPQPSVASVAGGSGQGLQKQSALGTEGNQPAVSRNQYVRWLGPAAAGKAHDDQRHAQQPPAGTPQA